MKTCLKTKVIHLAAIALFSLSVNVSAQSDTSDVEALREAAVEALITAPPERALPLARKVVEGDYSNDLKEKALFVLSQIDEPEAQDIVLSVARNESGDLQEEAIRMIGISGNPDAMAQLGTMFVEGDEDVREAVLEAYLIADDEDAVYQIAITSGPGSSRRQRSQRGPDRSLCYFRRPGITQGLGHGFQRYKTPGSGD
jgi:HEAT repeat protein